MTRGIKHWRDVWVDFMKTQMWNWKRKILRDPKTNKKLKKPQEFLVGVQGALRPVELWEYVFPEECLPQVLSALDLDDKGDTKTYQLKHLGSLKPAILRKMIGKGLKPIPKIKKVPCPYIEQRGMAIYPIGIKKDKRAKAEEWNVEQEMI